MNMQSLSPYTRPSRGTKTGRVWELADEITRRQGYRANRKQVIAAFVKEGGNPNTASTQHYYWSQKYDESDAESPLAGKDCPIEPVLLRVEPNGRVLIPSEYRDAMELGEYGKVVARIVDGELHMISPKMALRKAQTIAKKFRKPGESVVDEFLAERKSLWGEG